MRAIVGILVLGLMGCDPSAGSPAAPAGVQRAAAPAVPDVVEVDCSPEGTRITGNRFAAQRDGVHVRVRITSGATGVYVNYRYGPRMAPQGGDSFDSGSERVLELPPGPVQLNCSSDNGSQQDPPVGIEVLDPAGAWRSGALAPFGCTHPRWSLVDWIYRSGDGPTADAALAATVAQLDEPATWLAAHEGYVDSATQIYVMLRDGRPWASATVTRVAPDDYRSYLGSLCTPAS